MLASACMSAIVLTLPETARSVVGDGSIRGLRIYSPIVKAMQPPTPNQVTPMIKNPVSFSNILDPTSALLVLLQADSAVVITSIGILYMVYNCVQVSLATLFVELYGLNQLQSGLIYLPFGAGCAGAAFLMGH